MSTSSSAVSSDDPLESPRDNQHMVLLYDNKSNRNFAVAKYLNEGLKRNQLCAYASVSVRDDDHVQEISSLIADFEEHKRKGNLLLIDMAPIYIAALTGDLTPFQEAARQLEKMAESREDMHVRFVGDCTGFLFKNRHFEECLSVEGWGQQKPFFGSYLCPYDKKLFDSHPHNIHKNSVLAVKHDIVIDADKNTVLEQPFALLKSKGDTSSRHGRYTMGDNDSQ